MAVKAERSGSATAAGEPSFTEAKEQRISDSLRERKRRRLLAGASGFGNIGKMKALGIILGLIGAMFVAMALFHGDEGVLNFLRSDGSLNFNRQNITVSGGILCILSFFILKSKVSSR